MRQINAFMKRLDRRLIALVCLAVLPINILAIWFSSVAVNESREKILLSQAKEFQLLARQSASDMQAMENWLSDFVQTNLDRMIRPRNFSAVYSIYATNHIAEAAAENGIGCFSFVQEHWDEEKLYLRATGKTIPLSRIQQVKEEFQPFLLKQREMAASNGIREIDGKFYYYEFYAMTNYTLGIAVDLQQLINSWNTSLLSDCHIGIQSGDVTLWTDEQGVLTQNLSVSNAIVSRESYGKVYITLCQNPNIITGSVAYMFLQILAWASLVLLVLLWMVIRRQVIAPIRVLQRAMAQLEGDVNLRIRTEASTEDFAYLYDSFNRMAEDIQKSHEKDILIYETQLNNLKLQVNPHMLLNSLSMIYSLAQTKQYELIQKFTMHLVEYFRYCLKENNDLVALRSELKFVENYIELQKTRFPGELSYAYYVDDGLEKVKIPPLLIQNFVENATKYARTGGHPTEVLLWIRQKDNKLHITIEDTGCGIPETVLQQLNTEQVYMDDTGTRHIGIWNCRRRLKLFYGNDASVHLDSKVGKGTQVHIVLPMPAEGGEL